MPSPDDIFEPGEEPVIENQHEVLVGPRSIIILVGKVRREK
jgi:glycogen operon protein